jgi:hypothetical protein
LSVTTRLRSRWTRTLVLGLIALSVAILATLILSGRAEAQEQAANTKTTPVESGGSLWTIAQAQLAPDATPQQVAEEVERIYWLNRKQIGEDPNLIFPGQELLLARITETVKDASTTFTETAEAPTAEQQSAAEETPAASEAYSIAGSSSKENAEPSYPESKYTDRLVPDVLTLLLSLGVFLFTLTVAALAVSKLLRKQSLLRERHQEQKEEQEQVIELEVSKTGEAETSPAMPAASAGTDQANPHQDRLRPEFDRRTPKVLDERWMSEGHLDSYWDPSRDPGKSRLMMKVQPAIPGCEASGSFWVNCPLMILKIEARLKAAGYVCHVEAVPNEDGPVNNAPSSMIYCPKEDDDVASEVERLRSAVGNIPIIVLGSRLDPQLAQRIVLAGAVGIVHLERYPGQGAGFLSAAFEDEIAISRDYLEAILAEAISRTGPIVLASRQRRFLELVLQAPLVADNILVPKELLRAFVEGCLEEEPLSNFGGRSPVA